MKQLAKELAFLLVASLIIGSIAMAVIIGTCIGLDKLYEILWKIGGFTLAGPVITVIVVSLMITFVVGLHKLCSRR